MTCRHDEDDPRCSKNQIAAERERLDAQVAALPGTQFEIADLKRVGEHVVVRVRYPSCAGCSFEGVKVMVFLDVAEVDLMRWRRIDPHFHAEPAFPIDTAAAPSPAARFPPTDEGWQDALDYALRKARPVKRTR